MKPLFAALLLIHGLIHLMGFAKAFQYADLPQLTLKISRPQGAAWLLATVLFLATVGALWAWPQGFWMIGALAILVSQAVIFHSWTDAKFGTLANVVALGGVLFGFASSGPWSFRAQFEADAAQGLGRSAAASVLSEADAAHLPAALRQYLRVSGALGQPRVRNFHLTFKGRIRGGPDEAWMDFSGEQYNFYGPASRFFLITASKLGVPFVVFHRFSAGKATMRVRVAALVPMVDARGPEMTRAETVTLFNDMCVFAPGALVDAPIEWREIDPLHVSGRFTNASVTVEAVLIFNETGELVDFVSDDRLQGSRDGTSFTPMRWSTPLRDYRSFGPHRLSATGVGRWHPEGAPAYDYIEISVEDIDYNLRPSSIR